MFGHRKDDTSTKPQRLDSGPMGGTALALSEKLITVGIDGKAGFDSAEKVAQHALDSEHDVERAVDKIIKDHRKIAAVGGFVTGVGGFVTMAVALPANVIEFYLVATRMVAAIAKVRGYDITHPSMRSAVLLTLVGADADTVLKKAGVVSTGRLANLATRQLPPPAVMVVNKAVGFKLAGQVGEKALSRVGKAVPFAGAFIGSGLDIYLLGKIADNARKQFPPADRLLSA